MIITNHSNWNYFRNIKLFLLLVSIWSFKLLNYFWRLNTHLRRNKMSVLTKGNRLSNRLVHSMEQSPSWENNRFSASQEIPPSFTEPKVLLPYSWSLPILSQIIPVHALPYHFLKIHFTIILPSIPGPLKWFFPLRLPHQITVCIFTLSHTCFLPRPSHSFRFDQPNWHYRSLSSSLCSFLHSPVTPLSSAQIFSSATYSQTLSAPSMRASKFHIHIVNWQTYSYVIQLSLFGKKLHPALRIVQNK